MARESIVQSTFNYTRDNGVAPEIYFYEPPAGTQARAPGDDPREMPIHDAWPRAETFSLDSEGFALRTFRSQFDRWDDDEAIRADFYGDVTEFVRSQVGAKRVVVFDHTIRTKANTQQQTAEHATTQRAPVMPVHCDYTPRSGPLRLHQSQTSLKLLATVAAAVTLIGPSPIAQGLARGRATSCCFHVTDRQREGPVRCQERLGGLLRYYHREAA